MPLFCLRYEDEINKRTAAENEFVGLKKVSELGQAGEGSGDCCHGERAESALGTVILCCVQGNEVFDEDSCSE